MKGVFRVSKLILLVTFTILSVVNAIILVVWWSASEKTMLPPNPAGYTIESLALSVTFLEIALVLVGLILAIIGIIGYVDIRETAVRKATIAAQEEARKIVSTQLALMDRARGAVDPGQPEHGGTYGLYDVPVDDVVQPGGEE